MWIERVERDALLDTQIAAMAILMGANIADVSTVEDARREFREWLVSEPETYDPDKDALLIALGLR